jgi:hypothetical protein
VGPKAYAFYRVSQITGSVSDVSSAIFESYIVDAKGNLTRAGGVWYQGGLWRVERGAGYQIFDSGVLYSFQPEAKRVVISRHPKGLFDHNPSGFSVKSILADQMKYQWRDHVEIGTDQLDGKTVDRLILNNENVPERTVILANQTTHFPIEIISQAHSRDGWVNRQVMKASFDQKLPPTLFSHEVPKDTRVVDEAKELDSLKSRLEKPIAQFKAGDGLVTIRDVEVNERGHIFVLYTDGENISHEKAVLAEMKAMPHDGRPVTVKTPFIPTPSITAADSLNTQYAESKDALQLYMLSMVDDTVKGLVLDDGLLLKAAWLIPEKTVDWTPRRISISFSESGMASPYVYHLDLKSPNVAMLPDWSQANQIGLRSEDDLLAAERNTQRYGMKARNDWAAVAASLKEDLARYAKEEARGQNYAKGTTYYELYQALLQVGSRGEAREFLELAAKEPRYPGQYPDREIDQALKREGFR